MDPFKQTISYSNEQVTRCAKAQSSTSSHPASLYMIDLERQEMKPTKFTCLTASQGKFLKLVPAQGSASSDQGGWFARVARAQAAQPHWITPVVTVTPRLEEEFRYDIWEQTQPNGARLENYGGSKGPELIPTEHIQVTVGIPPYQV